MIKIPIRTRYLFACILVLATGCSVKTQSEKEAAFAKVVPVQGMNVRLKLEPLDLSGPLKQGTSFYIGIENISKDAIWFSNDLSVRMWLYDESTTKWGSVDNKVSYSGEAVVLEPKGKETPNFDLVVVGPRLPQGNDPITIRVVVMGKVYRDEKPGDEDVGGWVDVILPP